MYQLRLGQNPTPTGSRTRQNMCSSPWRSAPLGTRTQNTAFADTRIYFVAAAQPNLCHPLALAKYHVTCRAVYTDRRLRAGRPMCLRGCPACSARAVGITPETAQVHATNPTERMGIRYYVQCRVRWTVSKPTAQRDREETCSINSPGWKGDQKADDKTESKGLERRGRQCQVRTSTAPGTHCGALPPALSPTVRRKGGREKQPPRAESPLSLVLSLSD